MTYDFVPATAANSPGFIGKTIGPAGSNYPISAYGGDLGAAVLQFLTDSLASFNANGFYFRGIILAGLYKPSTRVRIPAGTQYLWLQGEGEGVTIIQPPRNSGAGQDVGPSWIGTDSLSTPILYHISDITFAGTRQSGSPPAATTGIYPGSGVNYVHGTTGATPAVTRALYQVSGIAVGGANLTSVLFTPAGGSPVELTTGAAWGKSVLAQILGSGYPLNVGDTLNITDTVDTLTAQYQYTNEYVDITTIAWQNGTEGSAQVDWIDMETTNSNHIGVAGIGSQSGASGWVASFRGCEDSHFCNSKHRSVSSTVPGAILIECYNGSFYVDGINFGQFIMCGIQVLAIGHQVGNGGHIITGNGPGGTQTYTLEPEGMNGSTSATQGDIHVNNPNSLTININLVGGNWTMKTGGGTVDALITAATATELATVNVDLFGPTIVCGASTTAVLCRTTDGTARQIQSVQGSFQITGSTSIATFTAQFTRQSFVVVSKGTASQLAGPAPSQMNTVTAPGALSLTTTVAKHVGLAQTITPQWSGAIKFSVSGVVQSSVGADGVVITVRRGTGGPPANGGAVTGNAVGSSKTLTVFVGNSDNQPFQLVVIDTGRIIGTTVWYDLTMGNVTSASTTVTPTNLDCCLEELPY